MKKARSIVFIWITSCECQLWSCSTLPHTLGHGTLPWPPMAKLIKWWDTKTMVSLPNYATVLLLTHNVLQSYHYWITHFCKIDNFLTDLFLYFLYFHRNIISAWLDCSPHRMVWWKAVTVSITAYISDWFRLSSNHTFYSYICHSFFYCSCCSNLHAVRAVGDLKALSEHLTVKYITV